MRRLRPRRERAVSLGAQAGQPPGEPAHAFLEQRLGNRVREAYVRLGSVPAEVHAWGEGDARGVERLERETLAVHPETRAIGVNEEAAGRHDRDAEAELAQRRNQEVAPRAEFVASGLDDRMRLRGKTRERRALRRRRR